MRSLLIWMGLVFAIGIPIVQVAQSPLLAWRDEIYIVAGFAGVVALALMLIQPLLAAGYLPGLPMRRGRRLHRWTGGALVLAVAVHVVGLWITSPPDVVDALLFSSPTPFSAWGVVAMWCVFAAALLAALRRHLSIGLRTWRRAHTLLVTVAVTGTVVHALLIEGTMGTVSKVLLCALVALATTKAVFELRAWAGKTRNHT